MERTLAKSALKGKEEVGELVPAGPNPRTQKPTTKENTKQVDVKLHTQQRAAKRAKFNYPVATKLFLMEQQKKHEEELRKMLEEEEARMLRKEMIPRAQLMPLFDRPFFPQRSSRPPIQPSPGNPPHEQQMLDLHPHLLQPRGFPWMQCHQITQRVPHFQLGEEIVSFHF